jgi:hypothetical protein
MVGFMDYLPFWPFGIKANINFTINGICGFID